MKITEVKKATIKVTNEEYCIIQTFCKWLNDNLCYNDISSAIEDFGEEELLFFEGFSQIDGNVEIEIEITD